MNWGSTLFNIGAGTYVAVVVAGWLYVLVTTLSRRFVKASAPPPSSGRKLVILDLDGVLVHRELVPEGRDADKARAMAPYGGHATVIGHYLVWTRPYLADFLRRLFEDFDVAVWTSASAKNVARLTDYLFPGPLRQSLVFELHRDDGAGGLEEVVRRFPQYQREDVVFISATVENSTNYRPCFRVGNTILVSAWWPSRHPDDFALAFVGGSGRGELWRELSQWKSE